MRILFHTFHLGDVEDVDIYVAEPIYRWQQTNQGQWCMKHCTNLRYFTSPDPNTYGYRIDIIGELAEGPLLTEYMLRWNIERSW